MAREVVYTDDISGEHGAEPVRIGWNDTWFEVDLAEENRVKLEEFITEYIDAGRPAGREVAPVSRQRTRSSKPNTEKTDYTDPSFAGNPHRGRVNPEEAAYVRSNINEVNARLKREGLREIDPNDSKMKDRYGL